MRHHLTISMLTDLSRHYISLTTFGASTSLTSPLSPRPLFNFIDFLYLHNTPLNFIDFHSNKLSDAKIWLHCKNATIVACPFRRLQEYDPLKNRFVLFFLHHYTTVS